jgi:hypothetical protein
VIVGGVTAPPAPDRELGVDPVVGATESRGGGGQARYQKNRDPSHVCRINADRWGNQDGIG